MVQCSSDMAISVPCPDRLLGRSKACDLHSSRSLSKRKNTSGFQPVRLPGNGDR